MLQPIRERQVFLSPSSSLPLQQPPRLRGLIRIRQFSLPPSFIFVRLGLCNGRCLLRSVRLPPKELLRLQNRQTSVIPVRSEARPLQTASPLNPLHRMRRIPRPWLSCSILSRPEWTSWTLTPLLNSRTSTRISRPTLAVSTTSLLCSSKFSKLCRRGARRQPRALARAFISQVQPRLPPSCSPCSSHKTFSLVGTGCPSLRWKALQMVLSTSTSFRSYIGIRPSGIGTFKRTLRVSSSP